MLQLAHSDVIPQEQLPHKKINWGKVIESIHLQNYQKQVSAAITPLIGHSYSSHNEINEESSAAMCCSEEEVEGLLRGSLSNEDDLLDIPFEPGEIDSVLKKLKLGKAAGHDGVQAEHGMATQHFQTEFYNYAMQS